MRYYSSDGYALVDPDLFEVTRNKYIPRETISDPRIIKNSILEPYKKDVEKMIEFIPGEYGADIISVRKQTSLSRVLEELQTRGVSYNKIDGIFCRSRNVDILLEIAKIREAPCQSAAVDLSFFLR